jgi:HAD superfamily hydrolase (TIGR01509 family)
VSRLCETGARKLDHMAVRAVVFDIGGVLEKVGPPMAWLGPWLAELSLTGDELRQAMVQAAPAEQIETGALTEPQYRARISAALGLTAEQQRRFFAGMWDWYCGELDTELAGFAASLRPRCHVAILSNSADGARREEHTRYRFADFFDPVLYSHEIGAAKPDPACYLLTCEALGLPPGEVVMVDDVPEFIAGARAVGMHGVLHRTARETAAKLSTL